MRWVIGEQEDTQPCSSHATAQSQPVDPGPFLQLLLYLLDAHEAGGDAAEVVLKFTCTGPALD